MTAGMKALQRKGERGKFKLRFVLNHVTVQEKSPKAEALTLQTCGRG